MQYLKNRQFKVLSPKQKKFASKVIELYTSPKSIKKNQNKEITKSKMIKILATSNSFLCCDSTRTE